MTTSGPTLIGGRYELGELLGRGGMAEVRKGTDRRLGRVVAVKRLRTDLAGDDTFQARFRREAQSSASLNHPSIVAVYDTGEEPSTDGSGVAQPYIVMEHVAGRTLRDILREGRKILPERALEITSGVLAALDYSHRAGIIHRDIKPGNVMLTPSGDIKVMDFGIARAMSDASSTMTQTAAVVGTAQYLSPEQARGETVDSRSDVYSTGCLLYELLTGRPPFVGDSPVAVAYQHVREPAAPPSDHDTDLPPEIDTIVMTALAKRLEERYQSAAAMRADIERYLSGRPVQAAVLPGNETTRVVPVVPPLVAGAGGDDATGTGLAPAATAPRPPMPVAAEDDPRRQARLLVTLGVLVLGLIVAAAYFVLPAMFESPPEQNQVPSLVGESLDAARQAIGDAGLSVGDISYEDNDSVRENHVISQDPNRAQYVAPGTAIDLLVSSGKPTVVVPSVVGQLRGDAATQIRAAGLKVIVEERDSDEDKNQVLEVAPAAGGEVPLGTVVTIYYSDGPERIPDVVGDMQDVAEQKIRAAGFSPVVRPDDASTEPSGTVTDQFPGSKTADQGSEVIIFVSTFVEPTPTPTPSPSDVPSDGATEEPPPESPLPTDLPSRPAGPGARR